MLEPIFDTAPAVSKNEVHVKSGQNRPKNNHLATYNLNPWNSLYYLKIITRALLNLDCNPNWVDWIVINKFKKYGFVFLIQFFFNQSSLEILAGFGIRVD